MKQSFHSSIFLSFILLLTLHQLPLFADILIPPDNPRINYYGRFDFSDPLQPRFNWSGAIIEVTFPGPKIGMRIAHKCGRAGFAGITGTPGQQCLHGILQARLPGK